MSANPVLDLSSSNLADVVYAKTNIGGWVFDAFLKVTHNTRLTITQHPVQSGAALTDHAYLQPKELIIEIGMSDAATSFVSGQFSDGWSRSTSAYAVLRELQEMRVPIQIFTKFNLYTNMLVESISAPDDYTTLYGMRATVTFREVIVAQVQTVAVSSIPTTTQSTSLGQQQPQNINQSITASLSQVMNGY